MLVLRIFIFSFTVHYICSIHFYMNEGDKKCFFEDLKSDIIFQGNYKIEYYDENLKKYVKKSTLGGLHVAVYTEVGEIILSKVYKNEGIFSFTTHESGEFKICLSTTSTSWVPTVKLKLYLDFQASDSADDYMDIQNREHVDGSKLKVKSIIHIMKNILSQQNYQRIKEEKFRELISFTNTRIICWSFLQAMALIFVGVWQMHNLKTFFKHKKIV